MTYQIIFKPIEKLADGLTGLYCVQQQDTDGVYRTCHNYYFHDAFFKTEESAIKFMEWIQTQKAMDYDEFLKERKLYRYSEPTKLQE